MTTLYVQDASGYREAASTEILARAQGLLAQRIRRGSPVFSNYEEIQLFLKIHLAALPHEVFAALFLDGRHRLIEYVELFRGTIDKATVHVREVVREALSRNAADVILVHNHPSGCPQPSQADEIVTRLIKDALALIDIRVVDHLIVGDGIYSFAEHGRI
jgi:DNA repair protein RadC